MEPIPALKGQEAGNTLDGLLVHHRADTDTFTRRGQLSISNTPDLKPGRKPEHAVETHTNTGRKCERLHKPTPFLLWDDSTTHCSSELTPEAKRLQDIVYTSIHNRNTLVLSKSALDVMDLVNTH